MVEVIIDRRNDTVTIEGPLYSHMYLFRSFNKNNKSSSCYKKMYAEYEAYCNAINEKNLRVELYDRAHKRIPEILNEVKKYLK